MVIWGIRGIVAVAFNAITLWAASILPFLRIGAGFWWAVVLFAALSLVALYFLNSARHGRFRQGRFRLGNGPAEAAAVAPRRTRTVRAMVYLAVAVAGLWLSTLLPDGLAFVSAVGWAIAVPVMGLAAAIQDFVDDGLEGRAARILGVRGPDSGAGKG